MDRGFPVFSGLVQLPAHSEHTWMVVGLGSEWVGSTDTRSGFCWASGSDMYMYALSTCHILDVKFLDSEKSNAVTFFLHCSRQTLDRLPVFLSSSTIMLACSMHNSDSMSGIFGFWMSTEGQATEALPVRSLLNSFL